MENLIKEIIWISINDRLPNEKEISNNFTFLVAHDTFKWVVEAHFNPQEKDQKWSWYNNRFENISPTHWALFPEAP